MGRHDAILVRSASSFCGADHFRAPDSPQPCRAFRSRSRSGAPFCSSPRLRSRGGRVDAMILCAQYRGRPRFMRRALLWGPTLSVASNTTDGGPTRLVLTFEESPADPSQRAGVSMRLSLSTTGPSLSPWRVRSEGRGLCCEPALWTSALPGPRSRKLERAASDYGSVKRSGNRSAGSVLSRSAMWGGHPVDPSDPVTAFC